MKNINKIGVRTAVLSFLIGTILFTTYFVTSNWILLFIGEYFIVVVIVFNVVILISLIKNKIKRIQSLRTIALMLLNIPVMIVYIWITFLLLGNMRIVLINKTPNTIHNISISGCETKYINQLKPNERKTIWIEIKGDCTINLSYKIDLQKKNETIAGYVTNGMGQAITYKIGQDNNLLF